MQANLEIHTIFSQHIFHELFEALLPWITWGEYFKTSFLIYYGGRRKCFTVIVLLYFMFLLSQVRN